MTSNHDPEDIRLRELELKQREMNVRLRELDAEIQHQATPNSDPARDVEVVTDDIPVKSSFKRTLRKVVNAGKFLAIVVAVVVAVKIAMWLAMAVVIGAIAYATYELFFKDDSSQH